MLQQQQRRQQHQQHQQQREIRQHQQRIRLKRQEDRYDRFNSKVTHKNDENYERVGSKKFSFEGKDTADNDCNNDNDIEGMEEKNHNREVKDKELKHDVIVDEEISRGEIDKTASDFIDMRKYRNIRYTTKTLKNKVLDHPVPALGIKKGHTIPTNARIKSLYNSSYNHEGMGELRRRHQPSEGKKSLNTIEIDYDENRNGGNLDRIKSNEQFSNLPTFDTDACMVMSSSSEGSTVLDIHEEVRGDLNLEDDDMYLPKSHPHYKNLLAYRREKEMEKEKEEERLSYTIQTHLKSINNNDVVIEPRNREMFAREIRTEKDSTKFLFINKSLDQSSPTYMMNESQEEDHDMMMKKKSTDSNHMKDDFEISSLVNPFKTEIIIPKKERDDLFQLPQYDIKIIDKNISRPKNVEKNNSYEGLIASSDEWSDHLSEDTEEKEIEEDEYKTVRNYVDDDKKNDDEYNSFKNLPYFNNDSNNKNNGNDNNRANHEILHEDENEDDDDDEEDNPDIDIFEEDDDDHPIERVNPNLGNPIADRADLDIHIALDEVLGIRPNRPWWVG